MLSAAGKAVMFLETTFTSLLWLGEHDLALMPCHELASGRQAV